MRLWDEKDGDRAARNRMNRNTFDGTLAERHGGQVEWVPGMFVHTFETDTAINEFLEAYYGDAAPQIRTYIDFMHDKAERENIHMGCYESPETALLTGDFFADSVWTEAEKVNTASGSRFSTVPAVWVSKCTGRDRI